MAQPAVPGTGSTTTTTRPSSTSGSAAGVTGGFDPGAYTGTGAGGLSAAVELFRQQVLQGGNPDLSLVAGATVPGGFRRGAYDPSTDLQKARPRPARTVTQLLNDVRTWNPSEIRELQQRLLAGGYYGRSYYGDGEAEVQWEVLDQDTRTAYSMLLADAVAYNRPLDTILSDRAQTFSRTGQLARGGAVGREPRVGGGNVYQNQVSDPAGIRSLADDVATQILGRKPTDEEKARYVPLIQELERGQQNVANTALEAADQARFAATGAAGEGAGGLVMPVNGGRVSPNFGQDRGDHAHGGIDISAPSGMPVLAAMGGTVTRVTPNNATAGNYIEITGTDGRKYRYLHLNANGFGAVKVGDQVTAGAQIGQVGSTGRSSGPHLHFEVHAPDGTKLDPSTLLAGAGTATVGGAAPNVVDQIMAAISGTESGGNYNAVNAQSGASGRFQIMPANWSPWAKEAGLGANAPRTPENQDRVARFKMAQYLEQFGSPEAVAVAWYAGPAAAADYVKNPNAPRFTAPQGQYPSIAEYARKVTAGLGAATGDVYLPSTTVETTNVDARARLEEQVRADNPAEAGAHDIAGVYANFRSILNRGAGVGSA